jgi:uncharacterized protein YacL
MIDQTIVALIVFIGSALGATLAALLPYYKKLREEQALGNSIKFDPVFMKTMLMGFVVGCVVAVMSFDANLASVDSNANVVKIFVTAFISASGGNVVINAFIKPSSVVTESAEAQKVEKEKQEEQHKEEIEEHK